MQLKTNDGYSLVETLVAVAIIACIAVIVANTHNFSNSGQRTNYKRVCESIANSAIAIIQERGPVESIVPFDQLSGAQIDLNAYGGVIPRGTNLPTDFFNSSNAAEFYNVLTDTNSTLSPQLNSYQQIRGSIRTLTSIYNNTPALRCGWGTFNPVAVDLTKIDMPTSISNLAVPPVMQISLVPFDTGTGAELACAEPALHIAPPPSFPNTISDAFFNGSGSQALTNDQDFIGAPAPPANLSVVRRTSAGGATVRWDRGIVMKSRVSLRVASLDGGNGETIQCETSQRFQYPADRSTPTAPTISLTNASSGASLTNSCNVLPATTRQATITITSTAAEEGVRFICRDLSARRGYVRPTSTTVDGPQDPNSIPCIINGAVDTSDLSENLVRARPGDTASNNFDIRSQNISGEVWRPCERVKICDTTPAIAGTPANLTLTYSNLPLGCLIHLEARAVDIAGNLSSISNSVLAAAPVPGLIAGSLDPAAAIREIEKPACGIAGGGNSYYVAGLGTYCNPSIINFGIYSGNSYYPNGYYTCRVGGCCIGSGCTPLSN